MIAAVMYIINVITIFWIIILLIATLIGTQSYDIFNLIIFLILTFLNLISLKKVNMENSRLELNYFNLIKKCSKFIKNEEFEGIYHYLRKLRKTKWYKDIDREFSIDLRKNLNQFYDIDEFKIDYLEK